jgi:hypothetical protein
VSGTARPVGGRTGEAVSGAAPLVRGSTGGEVSGAARLVAGRTGEGAPLPAVVPALHALLGGALLLAPDRLLAATGERPEPGTRVVARVLGGRHLAQGIALRLVADPSAAGVGGVVDGLHCASMVAAAALSRRHRRAAIASGLLAGALAAVELDRARRGRRASG